MRRVEGFLIALIACLVPTVAWADCGKIIVLTCPPGFDPSRLSGQGGAATTNGSATSTTSTTATSGSTTGSGGSSGGGEAPKPTDPNTSGGEATTEEFGSKAIRTGSKRIFREPNQAGVLAWNGSEEILVLKTNEQSKVGGGATLSFMPLPGKPIDIKEGDKRLWRRCAALLASKLQAAASKDLIMERTIGAHNIFVWEITNFDEFANKVQKYIRTKYRGKAVAVLSKDTERVVKRYFKAGFRYFAFDLVLVGDKPAAKVAIEYHFKSPYLYYPMVVSQSGGTGNTQVDLMVITNPNSLGKTSFRAADVTVVGGKSVNFTIGELRGLHSGMAGLFRGTVQVRHWRIKGKLEGFDKDLIVHPKS
jgi:hypothetical protein